MALDPAELDEADFLDGNDEPIVRFRLNPQTMEYLVIGATEWSAWQWEGAADIRVRLDTSGPRTRISGVAVLPSQFADDGTVTMQDLRNVPLVRLEAIVNDPRWNLAIRQAMSHARSRSEDLSPGSSIAPDSVSPYDEVPPLPPRYELAGVQDEVRPTEFYADVAGAWSAAIANGHKNPAEILATANGVALSTVHRWVREARRRKVMAPSSRAVSASTKEKAEKT